MLDRKYFIAFLIVLYGVTFFAQTPIEGYVFEHNNRGFINEAAVSVYELPKNKVRVIAHSDADGHFSLSLAPGLYLFSTRKDIFEDRQDTVRVQSNKIFLKMGMQRKPGYLFKSTLLEAREQSNEPMVSVKGTIIEMYNRTEDKMDHLSKLGSENAFQLAFDQGISYSILIRQPGYRAKRIEVDVNTKGCALCFDGVVQNIGDFPLNDDNRRVISGPVVMSRARLKNGVLIDSLEYQPWMTLEQIIEEEKIAQRAQEELKDRPKMEKPANMRPKQKQMPEANNSVPLPEATGAAPVESPEAGEILDSGAPLHRNNAEKSSKTATGVHLSPLDSAFTGYAIQVLKSRTALNASHSDFTPYKEIAWNLEKDGAYYYYLLPTGPLNQVRQYFRKTIKPNHRQARLVRFDKTGKAYIK
ncbi:MAG: hypothetical protein IT262_18800 [Saprospiraceae bacterium]|nr:hypothetical protein [Saprospiraceae bacterium]